MKSVTKMGLAAAALALGVAAASPVIAQQQYAIQEAEGYGAVTGASTIPVTFVLIGGVLVAVLAAVALGGGSEDPPGSPA